ncbi:MAG: hypothetical protein OHK0046_23080 [Anaerolineae bacterium]
MTRFALLLICAWFLALTFTYARTTPAFEAADEGPHFLYSHHLLTERTLPRILSRAEIAAQTDPALLWAIETHQPPLYYALGALLISHTRRDDLNTYLRTNDLIFVRGINPANHHVWLHSPTAPDGDTSAAIWILRMYSMVLGVGTLLCVYAGGRLVFQAEAPALLAMIFVASIPTFISISASINNDNLVTFLYAAGTVTLLRIWQRQQVTAVDTAALSLVLAAIALTKINGLSLFGLVFVVAFSGRVPRGEGWRLVVLPLVAVAVLAGWWYVRNLTLYGDPLAVNATSALWGRTFEVAATSGDPLAEIVRIWRSFWLMIGHLHLPVLGPRWLYVYAMVLVGIGLTGLWRVFRRFPAQRGILGLLLLTCALVIVTLLVGTRGVDISYGRLLFPMLPALAVLMVWGWRQWVGRLGTVFLIAPLIVMALITPDTVIRPAYPPLVPVAAVPETARRLDVGAETFDLLAYTLQDQVVQPGDDLRFSLYLRGTHAENPALVLSVVDLRTPDEALGQVQVYPGMAALDSINPAQVYRAVLRVPLDADAELTPTLLALQIAPFVPEPFRDVALVDGTGTPLETLLVDAAVFHDPAVRMPPPETPLEAAFGDVIALEGYTLSAEGVAPGDTVEIAFMWRGLAPIPEDWILTVQVLDANGRLLTQSDGMPTRYPTSAWLPGVAFIDQRQLMIPAEAALGDYHLAVAWYRRADFARLPTNAPDNLLRLPVTLRVQ